MRVLLTIESVALIVTLFASALAIVGWLLLRLLDSLVSFYVAVRQPETRGKHWKPSAADLIHLKRAGQ